MIQRKQSAYIACFVASSVLIFLACVNSIAHFLNPYSTFSWYLNYSHGLFKRALPGTLLSIYYDLNDLSVNFTNINRSIETIHTLSVALFLTLLIALTILLCRKHAGKRLFFFAAFIFLICSFFVKTSFFLVGYSDIIVADCVLAALLAYFSRHFLFASAIACVSCLVSELTLCFWLPVLAVHLCFLCRSATKLQLACLALPVFCAFGIHFCPIPTESFPSFFENSDISEQVIVNIAKLFDEQHHLGDLIVSRISEISANIANFFAGFLFIAAIALCFTYLSIRHIAATETRTSRKVLIGLVISGCSLNTLLLTLVAVDFSRMVAFSVFSSFITLICALSATGEDSGASAAGRDVRMTFVIASLLSLLTLFTPPILISSENHILFYNSRIEQPVSPEDEFVRFGLTIPEISFAFYRWYNFHDGRHEASGWNSDVLHKKVCPKDGGSINGRIVSPGRKKLMVEGRFNDSDPDAVKYLDLWGATIPVHRNRQNIYSMVLPEEMAARFPFILRCLPSNGDWGVTRFVLIPDNQ